ncbi:uncharacterized protein LOC126829942 [Patella vulgata]|uniref:uncharacterized protein LOC126829942 n=1 Tax=Patella vulgata TaxID=6465 RepID=UPI00217FBF51|nr:uncharacterized protein LOC126829942 [Patella vulgata]
MIKVKSLNVNVQILNAKEEITHLRNTVNELTEELEHLKRSKRFNRNSLKTEKTSGQKPGKTTAVVRKVTNDKKTMSIKTIESTTTKTHHTKQGDSKHDKKQKAGRIEISKPTDVKISKPQAVKIPLKPSTIVKSISKETATTINTKSRSIYTKKTTSGKSTLPTESSKQDKKTTFAEMGKISISKNISSSSRYSSSSPGDVAVKTPSSACSTIHTDIEDVTVEIPSLSCSTIHTDIEDVAVITPSLSCSTIHTDIDGSACSVSSSRSTDSVSISIEDEFVVQKAFQGAQKTAKAIATHSNSSPEVSYSINKIASGNSNQFITEVRHKKKLGLKLPSLITSEYTTTPPKIKSSSVNESVQKRFKMAKKVGAAPLPNLMKGLPSISGRFTPKPPSTPQTSTTNKTKLPPVSSNTTFNKRHD